MQKDKCVICGQESPYDETTHIDQRRGYVEGVGQTCFGGCVRVPRIVIENTPNNMDLGEKVRSLFLESSRGQGILNAN